MGKTSFNKSISDDKSTIILDPKDPLQSILNLLEKKSRNLEKRKQKGLQVKDLIDAGKPVNADQMTTFSHVQSFTICLEMLQDLSSSIVDMRNNTIEEPVDHTVPVTKSSPPCKEDNVKRVIDVQNTFKKLYENQENVKAIDSSSPNVLTADQTDFLLTFWSNMNYNKPSEAGSRVKKLATMYSRFIAKSPEAISPNSVYSFAEIHVLYEKIGATIFATKSKTSRPSSVASITAIPPQKETSFPVVLTTIIPTTKPDVKSNDIITNGYGNPLNQKERPNNSRNFQRKYNNRTTPLSETPSASNHQSIVIQRRSKETKIVVTDLKCEAKQVDNHPIPTQNSSSRYNRSKNYRNNI